MQAVEQTLREKYANLGGKLDLNNATRTALEDRLRRALPGAGVTFDEQKVKDLAAAILNYRDTVKGGIIRKLDELTKVPGVDRKIVSALEKECGVGTFNLRSAEMVGPRAGAQLRSQALLATGCALAGMLIYIAFRFQLISGAAAVIATVHDVIITHRSFRDHRAAKST